MGFWECIALWISGESLELPMSVRVRAKHDILRAGPTPLGVSKLEVPEGTEGTLIATDNESPLYLRVQWNNGATRSVYRSALEFVSF